MSKAQDIDFDREYMSKSSGPFRIVEELPIRTYDNGAVRRMVRVQFINTGYTRDVQLPVALKGDIKDPYYPSVYGVGCLGNYTKYEYHCKRIYDIWFHMIERCYNQNHPAYKEYGGIGIRVSDDWLCYEYFLRDMPRIPNFSNYMANPSEYSFDKDYLQQDVPRNEKVYSLETCMFLDKHFNRSVLTAMERKRYGNCTSKYFGVYKLPNGYYQASIMHNGQRHFLGTFGNEIAAATVYNWWANYYGMQLLNNVPFMSYENANMYKTNNRGKKKLVLCRIYNPNNNI